VSGRVVIAAGRLEAQILPRAGGSIARFDLVHRGERTALLRGTDDDEAHALGCGCFPLVPFCNRIRGGTFSFGGRTVRLAPNMPPDPSPLHGQGWLEPWEVTAHDGAAVALRYHHAAGEWPWTYSARQSIRIGPDGLSVELACRNLSRTPMPCGLGLHPYYPCDGATRLDARVGGAWTVDAAVLPVEHVPATGRYDLRDRAICGQDLDNGFDGWDGSATISWGSARPGLRLTSPDARFFQVYSPPAGGLFVAEPVQHANCALNAPEAEWPGLGMAVLQPDEERVLHARFGLVDQPSPAT
jgi:aldose 1-epimerase